MAGVLREPPKAARIAIAPGSEGRSLLACMEVRHLKSVLRS